MDSKDNNIHLTGYHATKFENIEKIIHPNDFKASNSSKDWLGRGVYFWDEIYNAKWWADIRYKNEKSVILKSTLECDDDLFLDLDSTEEIHEYKKFTSNISDYIKQLPEDLQNTYLNLNFTDIKAVRCFYLNVYKLLFDIALVRRTFDVEGSYNADDGITLTRTQLCVTDSYQNQVIEDIEVCNE